ncbi:threonine synthase [Planococcus shixiaomingii]|uniref:threonine synthase n=1 Tax=Planococcus shixiaomingii TaxID=3058393 RepID=UPI002606BCA9|nr:threonine synthase [Planococcus sp. N022]WKA55486.1 threonine synthase [Planococcus sp. N022]
MAEIKSLTCIECGHGHQAEIFYKCERCEGSLDIEYNYEMHREEAEAAGKKESGIWKYRSFLPVAPNSEPVTLGEGNTPLLRMPSLEMELEQSEIYFKNESANPTLAFKDRALSVALTAAKQFNVEGVITASTGNTGVSAAAYAARAKLPCKIYVPKKTPNEKLRLMKIYGAEISLVEGNFSDAYLMAAQQAETTEWFNVTSTFLNPYAVEGNKTIAYEIHEQFGDVPDWIVIPIGAGPLLVACFKGFKELQLAGKTSKLPRMAGVQAASCAPIAAAFENGLEEVAAWKQPIATVASGIADPLTTYPKDGTRTLKAIYASDGCGIAVEDDRMLHYQKKLAIEEGVFAEPSSATAIAALELMKRKGYLRKNESVVSVITGHGLKDLMSIQ